MLFGYDLNVIAIIGIILLIGIVKKNAIMMIDFALEAERVEGHAAARGDLSGLPAALPPDHDDHHGGDPRRAAADARHRHRLRAAPAARPRHRRRPDRQPGADAVHDAGDLSLFRPAGRAADRAPGPAGRLARAASRRNEHFRAFHRPAGGDDAADARASRLPACWRFSKLPVAPLPQVDFPTISVSAQLPGASPDDGGDQRRQPARAPSRPDRRRHRDDLAERHRPGPHHAAIRPQPRHRRRGARRPGRHQSPRAPTCRRACGAIRPTARSTRPTRRS